VIDRTFQLVSGIGPWREKDLWARGIRTWSDFPSDSDSAAVSNKVDTAARAAIAQAQQALADRDLAALGRLLPSREHWRCYSAFADQAVFFDIETDGRDSQRPTVVSLFHAQGLQVFIEGRNMDALPEALAQWPLWVTFNGTCYDVPILRGVHPSLQAPALHIDLRFVSRRLGFGGGLKQLEDDLGLSRPLHLRGTNGADAVVLWRAYQATGDVEALRYLVEYNLYDAFQLRGVIDRLYNQFADRLACDITPLVPFERGEILYDVSRLLLELSPSELDQSRFAAMRAAADFPTSRLVSGR
jgi:uncharacterized protein YprB with RNaseH-like and TPR domain